MYHLSKKIILAGATIAMCSFAASVAVAYGMGNFGQDLQTQIQTFIQEKFGALEKIHNRKVCDSANGEEIQCNARVVLDAAGNPMASISTPSGYGPKQLLAAYNLSGIAPAAGSIIGIVDAYDDPRIVSDLSAYSAAFGIPKLPTCAGPIQDSPTPCFQKMNENGSTSFVPRSNAGWDIEIALDVEVAHATCENCSILLVEANSASYNDLMKAVDTAVGHKAIAVSGSWGSSEFSGEKSFDSHFNKTGVAFTFSAGDGGYATSYPASSPYVTAVGGTTLLLNSDNSYLSEKAWSGTGSGCSSYESKPSWQNDSICKTRTMADVAADADPTTGAAVYDSVSYYGQSGWFQVGGTSLSRAPHRCGIRASGDNARASREFNSVCTRQCAQFA